MSTTFVSLTDSQMLMLDGIDNDDIQVKVDAAKRRLGYDTVLGDMPEKYLPISRKIIQEIEVSKKLVFRRRKIRECEVCHRQAGYAKYTRNSKYHTKGDTNFSQPLYMQAIELAERFVSSSDRAAVGMCLDCWNELGSLIAGIVINMEAEIPAEITGVPPRYKAYDRRECLKCGWQGHEGEMGMLPAVMRGEYPGKCPECGSEQNALGYRKFALLPGVVAVRVVEG